MAGDYHSGVQDGQLLIEGANVGTGQGGPVAFTGGNSTANPGSGGEFIAQAGAGTTSGGYVSIDAGDATVDGTGGAAQLTGGDGIGAGKTGGPVFIASGLGTGGATGADITLESSKDIWLKAAAGGHVYINNPAASFAAKQDMSLLTTAERTYTWPDTSGTLWVDNHSTGLTSVDDPLLTWTPVAGSGGGYKAFAGGGGFSFSISQSGATGLITATTATGSWFFDGGVGAAQILEVNGRIKATKFNHLAITNNTLGSQTLDIALNKTLTISNTLRFVGTDSTVHTFPSTSSSVARIDAAQAFAGVQTFGGTLINRSTTATQFITGYDSSNGIEFNTDSIGGTVITPKSGTAMTTAVGFLRISPSVSSMATASKAWTLRVDDLSGNQRFWLGRTTGANALNHGMRIGFDDSNYLQFQGGTAAAGVMAMTLVGITSLTLPNPTTCANLTATAFTCGGSLTSNAATSNPAWSFTATATRDTGVSAFDIADPTAGYLMQFLNTTGTFRCSLAVDLKFTTAGKGIFIKEGGAADTMGIATLVAGVAVVATTRVTANSRIFLTRQTVAGTVGTSVDVTARTAGTSFTITAAGSILDTSTVAWLIIEPA